MEKYLLISVLILLVSLIISFIIFINDYRYLKANLKRMDKLLNHCKEILNLNSEINKGIKNVYDVNNILIEKLSFIVAENTNLRRIIISNNKNNET